MFNDMKTQTETFFGKVQGVEVHKIEKEDKEVKKRLKTRHDSFLKVFRDNYIIGMLRNKRFRMNDMEFDEVKSVYRLSAIDLFVEKAIVILEREAKKYQVWGQIAIIISITPIIIGIIVAFYSYLGVNIPYVNIPSHEHNETKTIETYRTLYLTPLSTDKVDNNHSANQMMVKKLIEREVELSWREVLIGFVKSFTFYGLLVLMSVLLMRFGKSFIDQAERLFNRRHALREGRLYLHLKNGYVETVEEFDQVFNWNTSQDNAFATIPTDAQAPWGTALKEALNIIPKTVEASKGK